MRWKAFVLACLLYLTGVGFPFSGTQLAHAEYADVVINRQSDKNGMRPVVFPHWFHRIRFRCKVCHAELGFKMRAGSNEINMTEII